MGNRSGDLGARGVGDVSAPQPKRVRPDAAQLEACGDGQPTAAGASWFMRMPYLQQVTDRSAMVLWTTGTLDGDATLEVTRPDGTPVTTRRATQDPSARLVYRGRQLAARVDGLEPDTIYCYALSAGGRALTARAGFRTAPSAGGGRPVSFVAFGDSGEGNDDQYAVLEQLETVPWDLMLMLGDVAYPSGTRQQIETKLFQVYQELFRALPVFPVSGNHEYKSEDAAPFLEAFALPENGGPEGRERWYSFDWGDVHFVALDTERMGPAQALWLDADLAANRRPWTVVYGHRPPYSSGVHGSDATFRRLFVPILEAHRVPLVLTGHDHHYERVHPQNGVTYFVTGGGGRGVRDAGSSTFTAFSEPVIHFVYGVVEGDRLTLHAIDGTGREFDGVVIERPGGS
jgi:hypothetical protein